MSTIQPSVHPLNVIGDNGIHGPSVRPLAVREHNHDSSIVTDLDAGTTHTEIPATIPTGRKNEVVTIFVVCAMLLLIAMAMELLTTNFLTLKQVVTAHVKRDGKHHQTFLVQKPSVICPLSVTQAAMTLQWSQSVILLQSMKTMVSGATMVIRNMDLVAKSATGTMI